MERTISDRAFMAKCLELVDDVANTGRSIVILRRGKPVARLDPVVKARTLRGFYKDKLRIVGDIMSPVGGDPNADD